MPSSIFRTLITPLSEEEIEAARRAGHFAGIDLLRGLAAVAVVIWHYQFFFQTAPLLRGEYIKPIDRNIEPMYSILWPLYEHGYWAVPAFWIISGFVFAHVYAGRQTTARAFLAARFARLYPLHLVTLVAIAIFQAASYWILGGYQICSLNDAYHFILNLLFASFWGFQDEMSFNVPIWSVSIEIPIYATFFLVAPVLFKRGILGPLAMIFFGWILFRWHYVVHPFWFGLCMMNFYTGAAAYFLCRRASHSSTMIVAIGCLLGFAAMTTFKPAGSIVEKQTLLFLPIVLMLGILGKTPALGKIRWIGDGTYSVYLWHFPMIVLATTIMGYYSIDRSIFESPIVLLSWITVILIVGIYSYRYIERPLQQYALYWLSAPARSRELAQAK